MHAHLFLTKVFLCVQDFYTVNSILPTFGLSAHYEATRTLTPDGDMYVIKLSNKSHWFTPEEFKVYFQEVK